MDSGFILFYFIFFRNGVVINRNIITAGKASMGLYINRKLFNVTGLFFLVSS